MRKFLEKASVQIFIYNIQKLFWMLLILAFLVAVLMALVLTVSAARLLVYPGI